tara:strand:+ start:3242 stop:3643 length:402 start_codon:yes stop_codon:yes gene_type:complete
MMTQTTQFFTGRDELQKLGAGHNKIDNWIDLLGNNIFTVQFIKLNGELRTITGRLNVHKYALSGIPKKAKTDDENLCVFDMNKLEYRNVNINRVVTLSCHSVMFRYSTHHVLRTLVNNIKEVHEEAENLFCQT